MGAWGVGIFSDDLAADVRDDWRAAIIDGEDPDAATRRLVEEYRDALDDGDEEAVFWMALAAAQMDTGRLRDDVRDKALEAIANGGDVERWEPEDRRRRAKAIERLGEKLRGPQPKPKRLRRSDPPDPGVEVGDVVRVTSDKTSESQLFAVLAIERLRDGTTDVIVEALHWEGTETPTREQLLECPPLIDPLEFDRPVREHVGGPRKADAFGPHIGEVVARGVERPVPEWVDTYGTWEGLRVWIGREWHRACVEATRERAAQRRSAPRRDSNPR